MLDESAPAKPRRIQAAASILYRQERRAVLPLRKQIGELQQRAAFVVALATSPKTAAHGALAAHLTSIRAKAAELDAEIDNVAARTAGGPADDCRRALQQLTDRLDDIAP